ncbi:sodium/hydrogen exchanger 9B2-like [Mytilus californianus]|uniref:sodium/hydrogen exchanger 9B2-like n=1 Tax=Mytilus californianus TaxID=6549 RepID=UPI0022482E0A|nr:sodium/hydrogen exchanger 9B2-like [Mytilus californianus]
MNGTSDIRQRDVKHGTGNGKIPNGHEDEVDIPNKKDHESKKTPSKIDQIQDTCTTCCIPCLTSHNPLPENPSRGQRFKHAFMLPLHGNVATYLQFTVVCVQLWIIIYSLTHGQALPGGNLFSLLILFIGCAIGGYFISLIRLPPLLGMLIVGVLLRNIPGVNTIGESIDSKWSGALRKIALTVILTRAGLGLDIVKLRKLSWAVIRLAFLPCTCEIITVGIASHFILGFPWIWSLMLGCILGALSPAVTVPSLVNLQDRQYGVAKGIPTMLLAAGGLDNVLCVTGFSVFMGIIFSEGDLAVTIVKGPLGVFVGIVYGFVAGVFLWYIPSKDSANKVFYRSLLLFGFGMIAIFGSSEIGLSGAGPLGCLTTATVAGYKWRLRRKPGEQDEVSGVMALVWLIAQHFLFGLIGAAVDIGKIQSSTAGLGILTLAIGLVVRSGVDFTVTLRTGFNIKERIFITLTWLSKATVQAAIGGLALDKVREMSNPDQEIVKYATDILTLSVLAIIICAPIGATLMAVLGPKFLQKGYIEEESIEICTTSPDVNDKHIQIIDMTKVKDELIELKEKPEMTEIAIEPLENTNLEFSTPSHDNKDTNLEISKPSHDNKITTTETGSHKDSDVIEVPVHNEEKLTQVNEEKILLESDVIDDTIDINHPDYPEVYKSHLIVTLSDSKIKDTVSVVQAEKPKVNDTVSIVQAEDPKVKDTVSIVQAEDPKVKDTVSIVQAEDPKVKDTVSIVQAEDPATTNENEGVDNPGFQNTDSGDESPDKNNDEKTIQT